MNIVIKKLSPELVDDYLYFFDNIAFSDGSEWGGCYCVYYHWTDYLDTERANYEAAGGTCYKRNLAIQYIQENILQGYLAFIDGSVVGWCNANDKGSYAALSKEHRPDLCEAADDTIKIKLIVCYSIAPNMRRKGIATQLLNRVCEDAKSDGYTCVEAYPGTSETNHLSYHGPYSIYEKNGFSLYKEFNGEAIVRKYY